MNPRVLLDTDIVVDFLRGDDRAFAFIQSRQREIVLSAITVAELYSGARDENEADALDQFLSLFPVVPVTRPIARTAGFYQRDWRKSHGLMLGDAVIAATAREEDARLATLNVRHFPMFSGLKPPYKKS
ncbi:MAG: type II toxin-antitoxin system VapC family toxin [Candidatus Aureabacteria bacterium]|nr:type II toxin-antitoxin system VapC family toxin [Candidatus Auribacterota bacterium]